MLSVMGELVYLQEFKKTRQGLEWEDLGLSPKHGTY